jgi:hypothetical protein
MKEKEVRKRKNDDKNRNRCSQEKMRGYAEK